MIRGRAFDVAVAGGAMRVVARDAASDELPALLLVHGVTSSHLAWQWLADALPEAGVIAPDLRGRGRSSGLPGPAGLAAHADDLAAVVTALHDAPVAVVGHSMGAFVALVLADRHPRLVSRLILVDGGLPLQVPPGSTPEDVVASVLGPTAARLGMRFADAAEYRELWRRHPAFRDVESTRFDEYVAYDLVPAGAGFRPATSYAVTVEDTIDLHTGAAFPRALSAVRHPTDLVTVTRGLQGEEPGLYAEGRVDALLADLPAIRHHRWSGFDHYSVVMSDAGATALASLLGQLSV